MSSCAVESTIDVAIWFLDRARLDDKYLQAQKLQRLLYFAHGFYGAKYHGRKLMPATFVTHELGPIEPNIFINLALILFDLLFLFHQINPFRYLCQ